MICHENRLLADDSHVYHALFLSKIRKNVAKLSSAAVVIGALRVKSFLRTKASPSPALQNTKLLYGGFLSG